MAFQLLILYGFAFTLTGCLLTLSQFFHSRILKCWKSAAILGSPNQNRVGRVFLLPRLRRQKWRL